MATEVAVEAPAAGAFSRRLRERLSVWRRLFLQNWNLFKASRIGVIGLAIMIAFVVLALAAPFMGLRDPIRWTAPDADPIRIETYWFRGPAPAAPPGHHAECMGHVALLQREGPGDGPDALPAAVRDELRRLRCELSGLRGVP